MVNKKAVVPKKWKNMDEFWKDVEEAKENPAFVRALRAFIKYHSQ
jgi:hypothetical protein